MYKVYDKNCDAKYTPRKGECPKCKERFALKSFVKTCEPCSSNCIECTWSNAEKITICVKCDPGFETFPFDPEF